MADIFVRWADDNLRKYGRQIKRLERDYPKVLPRIVNQVGNRAKTQVIRSLTKQTGLSRSVIVEAVKVTRAGGKRLSYDMVTRGGDIRLKYLNARETKAGVVARPFGKRTLYPGAFMMGGAFPDRKVVDEWRGHAMVRNRNGNGRHFTYARSGVVIPHEMTTGATEKAFLQIAGPLLNERVRAALRKLAP